MLSVNIQIRTIAYIRRTQPNTLVVIILNIVIICVLSKVALTFKCDLVLIKSSEKRAFGLFIYRLMLIDLTSYC